MEHPAPIESFSEPVRRAFSAPPALRMMAARGMAPLPPATLVSVLYLLSHESDEALSSAAKATIAKLPQPVIDGALKAQDAHPAVLDTLASREDLWARIIESPNVAIDTVVRIATQADEALCEQIAVNEQRLLAHKEIIEGLYLNRNLRMSTADRLCELAARNGVVLDIPSFDDIAASLKDALIPEPGEETPADEMFREAIEEAEKVAEPADGDIFERAPDGEGTKLKKDFEKVAKRIEDMTISEKIRTAMLGSAAQRRVLACSPIRSIAEAAIKSPRIQPDEVTKLVLLPEIHVEVLRMIARRGDWLKGSNIRFYLAKNPKTPTNVAMAQLTHLNEFDLKTLEKSKTVPFQIRSLSKQMLAKRKEKKG
jgi:hypothetical protein